MSQEDREQAKSAARRAGVPVGVWLSQQIRTADPSTPTESSDADATKQEPSRSERSRGSSPRGGPDSRFSFGPGQWSVATDAVDTGQIAQPPPQPWMSGRPAGAPVAMPPQSTPPQSTAMHPNVPPPPVNMQQQPQVATHWAMPPMAHPMYMQHAQPLPAPSSPPVDPEALKGLERKIESLQKRLAAADARAASELEAFSQKLEKIDDLAREVDALRSSSELDDGPNYSTAPVERAVMRLSERLQRIEDILAPEEANGGFFARLFGRR